MAEEDQDRQRQSLSESVGNILEEARMILARLPETRYASCRYAKRQVL